MMKTDIRSAAAKFYDLNPNVPLDVPFYQALIPAPTATILELGCGTGRVTLSLAAHCRTIRGIDLSPAMVGLCLDKLSRANLPPGRVAVSEGDITDFDLGERFDLIIAPYRVVQNLETDTEVDGLFRCIRKHLAPSGTCVLNVFKPLMAAEDLRERWVTADEKLAWEVPFEGGTVTCHDRRLRMDEENLVLYPDLIYRRYAGDELKEEVILHLAMRCYNPEAFDELITRHGFQIVDRWGGYAGEAYGDGFELVVQFRDSS
jgi:SAM-dependent methyltransferase